MKLKMSFIVLILVICNASVAGCLDDLTTSKTIVSKVRGFYINRDNNDDTLPTGHNVILDKNTCTASSSGDVTLASATKSHYYLRFNSEDKDLYALLLSSQARDVTVSFRMKPDSNPGSVNEIAYILSPSDVNQQ